MNYQPQHIQQIELDYIDSRAAYNNTLVLTFDLQTRLSNQQAQEFLLHGASRRLQILNRCIENIFSVYPPSRTESLRHDELVDICINLHAFFVDLFGIFDNLAWVFVHEKGVSLRGLQVGLYKDATQALLTDRFREYLNSVTIAHWHNYHLREFRDALVHRIPLYIPPSARTEQGEIVSPFPCFAGSIVDRRCMVMHAQLLADFNTVVQVINKFVEFEFPPVATTIRK